MDFEYIKGYAEFLTSDLESDFIENVEQLEYEMTAINKELSRLTESIEMVKEDRDNYKAFWLDNEKENKLLKKMLVEKSWMLVKIKDKQKKLKKTTNQESKWIKTTEKLPDYNGWFLCSVKPNISGYDDYVRKSKDCVIRKFQNGWESEPLFNSITHWMPLPEPPEND